MIKLRKVEELLRKVFGPDSQLYTCTRCGSLYRLNQPPPQEKTEAESIVEFAVCYIREKEGHPPKLFVDVLDYNAALRRFKELRKNPNPERGITISQVKVFSCSLFREAKVVEMLEY